MIMEMENLDSCNLSTLWKSGEHDMPAIGRDPYEYQVFSNRPVHLSARMLVGYFFSQSLEDLREDSAFCDLRGFNKKSP